MQDFANQPIPVAMRRAADDFVWLLMIVVAGIGSATNALSQTASEYQVKSAYLYNFAKATQWPQEKLPDGSALLIGVYGDDDEFVNVLQKTVANKSISGHPIEIRSSRSVAQLRSCNVVFVRASERDVSIIPTLSGAGVLLVGEDPKFLSEGGMINLAFKNGRVTFEVNPQAIANAGVHYGQSAPATAGAQEPIIESAGVRAIKDEIPPAYPEIARNMSLKGTVQLQLLVEPDGTVKEVQVIGGHPMLVAAAEEAVMKWRYQNAQQETKEIVRISFGGN